MATTQRTWEDTLLPLEDASLCLALARLCNSPMSFSEVSEDFFYKILWHIRLRSTFFCFDHKASAVPLED